MSLLLIKSKSLPDFRFQTSWCIVNSVGAVGHVVVVVVDGKFISIQRSAYRCGRIFNIKYGYRFISVNLYTPNLNNNLSHEIKFCIIFSRNKNAFSRCHVAASPNERFAAFLCHELL